MKNLDRISVKDFEPTEQDRYKLYKHTKTMEIITCTSKLYENRCPIILINPCGSVPIGVCIIIYKFYILTK